MVSAGDVVRHQGGQQGVDGPQGRQGQGGLEHHGQEGELEGRHPGLRQTGGNLTKNRGIATTQEQQVNQGPDDEGHQGRGDKASDFLRQKQDNGQGDNTQDDGIDNEMVEGQRQNLRRGQGAGLGGVAQQGRQLQEDDNDPDAAHKTRNDRVRHQLNEFADFKEAKQNLE